MLAASSKEFENLFYLMEAESSEIHITKFTIDEMEKFLLFIYTGADNILRQDPWGMLKISKYYAVISLEEQCHSLIASYGGLFEKPSFLQIERDSLTKVLQNPKLITKEIDIYKAVNLWSENFCNQNNQQITSYNKRSALGPALKFIRFGVMTSEEFYTCSEVKHCFLNDDEKLNIFKFISSRGAFKCEYSSEKRNQNLMYSYR